MSNATTASPVSDGGHDERAGVGSLLGGRYRLDRLIGQGGTADVYRGTDELLGRPVAIKLFDLRLTGLNTSVRQRNEMQVLARLSHPNLIAVYDARIAQTASPATEMGTDRTYLILELVVGRTLADTLDESALHPGEVASIGVALASALEVVHEQRLVHRDVKPTNILLGDSGQIKLGDFGLARVLQAENRLTTGADVMGTAAYFSPEQASAGVVGPPADIYSLGLVLLEALKGHREFPGEPVTAAIARLLRDPVVPPELPQPWPSLLTSMTNSDPRRRPTAAQVRAVLVSVWPSPNDNLGPATAPVSWHDDDEPPTAPWSSPLTPFLAEPVPARRALRSRRHVVVAGIGAAATVVTVGVWLAAHSGPTDSASTSAVPPSSSSPSSRPATTARQSTPTVHRVPRTAVLAQPRPSVSRPGPTVSRRPPSNTEPTAGRSAAADLAAPATPAPVAQVVPSRPTKAPTRHSAAASVPLTTSVASNKVTAPRSTAPTTAATPVSPTPGPPKANPAKGHDQPKPPKKPKK